MANTLILGFRVKFKNNNKNGIKHDKNIGVDRLYGCISRLFNFEQV